MLIGIAGKAGAGKDTAAKWFNKHCYLKLALAEPIKDMLNQAFGWTWKDWEDREWKERVIPELGFSPRQAAQTLGTDWRNAVDPSKMLWCKLLEMKWKFTTIYWPNSVVLTDIRFPHEQDWVHSHGGKVLYIERENIPAVAAHSSENSIDMKKVDLIIYNTGSIQQLYEHLDISCKQLKGEL